MKSILVVSNEAQTYPIIASTYQSGVAVKSAALEQLRKKRFDLIFIDLDALNNHDCEENYKESLKPFWQLYPSVEIIVMTRQDKIRKAVNAVKAGADDYLTYPLNAEELKVERACILEASSVLTPESFPNELFEAETSSVVIPTGKQLTLAQVRQQGVEEIERKYLKDVLARNKGKINATARDAGISCRQLNKLMNRYGIRKEEYKL
jgi:DNA-binding NtrC family response regulator